MVKKLDIFEQYKDDPRMKRTMENVARLNKADDSDRTPLNNPPLVRLSDERGRSLPKGTIESLYQIIIVSGDDPANSTAGLGREATSVIMGMLYKHHGTVLFKQGKYSEAREAYEKGVRSFLSLSDDDPLPWPTAVIRPILKLEPQYWADAVACANNCAYCATKEGDEVLALRWFQEVHCMYECYGDVRKTPVDAAFPWKDVNMNFEEFVTLRLRAYGRQAAIYRAHGNTAAAYATAWAGFKHGQQILPNNVPRTITELREKCDIFAYATMRHPDPNIIGKLKITDPQLQVRGVWKKLRISEAKKDGPASRLGAASFVWQGKYYVFGGEHGTTKVHSDCWVINLRDISKGWRRLSPGPWPANCPTNVYFRCAFYNGKAYLVEGSPSMSVFDIETERWSRIETRMRNRNVKWTDVFPGHHLRSYAVQIIRDKMYVFGGCDQRAFIGRNALLVLDLKTNLWDLLSGTADLKANIELPGPREHPVMWAMDNKLYVGYGNASREGAFIHQAPEGAQTDHSYEDLWTYDTDSGVWTQEKIQGSPPCLRTEVGYTFNKKWNRTVLFGGYCSTLSFKQPTSNHLLTYTYFADTFLWSPETQSWSIVLSRGFPTYRAMGDLVTDEETGKTSLFGGYTNTDYTPSTRSSAAQTFNDLWELCVDVPNGGFDDAARAEFDEADARFSNLGPWRACFKCGSVGRWQRCNGACRDTDQSAAFCGVECLKAGWADHKRLNSCRKI